LVRRQFVGLPGEIDKGGLRHLLGKRDDRTCRSAAE
jgi:hypothetical protein